MKSQRESPKRGDMTPAKVANLVEEILGLDTVALDDSFFDLGGNSLTAVALISEIYLISGVKLSMRDILGAPMPAGLSQLIIAYSNKD
jgi:acyl carrier protein